MLPSRSLYRLVIAIALCSAIALAWPAVSLLLWAIDGLLLGTALVDLIWVLREPTPAVERRIPRRAGLGRRFVRVLELETQPGRPLRVHEEYGPLLERLDDGAALEVTADAQGRSRIETPFQARVRGVHAFARLRIAKRSALGLWWRQTLYAGTQTLEIEPPLTRLRETLELAASERWRDPGVKYLRRRGGLSEFESLREHVTGDDVRLVDWKAFAKRGRPIVREFQEERGQELILLFDCGRRMALPGGEPATDAGQGQLFGWTKLDHALDTGLQLAAVALRQGDRVGAMAFGAGVLRWVAPARSSKQLERLRDALFDLCVSEDEPPLDRILAELALRHRRRAYVVIFSDIADPLSLSEQRRALSAASRRHTLLFVALDDPELRAARRSGDAWLAAAVEELRAERAAGARALEGGGVRVLDALPAESALPLLSAWLALRRR